MSGKRPLRIGISACFFHADPKRPVFKGKTLLYLEQSLSNWILSHEALAYLIPAPSEGAKTTLRQLAAEFDGLVLQGGSDVSPRTYGEKSLKPDWEGDYHRDQYEIELVREFVSAEKPVLGVCRGAQLVNVAFGGTLYQDIATEIPGSLVHRDWEIYDQNFHEIDIEPDSRLSKLLSGQTRAKVNSVHHQAIKELGKGLVVEARCSDDKIIEAVRAKSGPPVFAVQWHPEFHDPKDPSLLDSSLILEDFLKQAQERQK